jgi:hypothetical protein
MKNHAANRAPKWKLPKNSQILIKSIGPIKVWEVHEKGLDFEEIWIDLTAETASEEWETRLVFDNPTQAEEFITKLRGALAQKFGDIFTPVLLPGGKDVFRGNDEYGGDY